MLLLHVTKLCLISYSEYFLPVCLCSPFPHSPHPLTPNPLVQIPPVTKYLFIEGYLYKKAGTTDWINLFCTHAFLFKM